MCGICGIIDDNVKLSSGKDVIHRMCAAMEHRGPDDEGVYAGNRVWLGHRRLKIIDLSAAGHQPMANEDGTVWIVFNGEIYNYQGLRDELIEKGHIFRSHTDTEVVIHLYEEYGQDCAQYLRGMFAFAIWDEREQVLLLFRDRVGKKPLLYYHDGHNFCFASEFAALLAGGLVDKKIKKESIDYYLSFGYVPSPSTIYENVFKLPPAHVLILKDGGITLKRYWQLDYYPKIKISEQEASAEILSLLREATRIRLNSDVPLGAFLSGGIDSSTVVALMSESLGKRIKTFSIGFKESDYNELKFARSIAERFCTQHHEFIVDPKALEILPLLVERYGEPYADSSCIPTYYVSQQTKQYVTVALNGDGGDESFAGYERYPAMLAAEAYKKMPDLFKNTVNALSNLLPDSANSKNSIRRLKRFIKGADMPFSRRYLRWIGIFDEALKPELYSEDFLKYTSKNNPLDFIKISGSDKNAVCLLDSLLYTDTTNYLPNDLLVKMDIVSMANSLEARSPFLDHKLMEFVARLPSEYKMKGFIKKYILKKALRGLVPCRNIQRKKMGFGVPVGEWFRGDLNGFLSDMLLSKVAFDRGYFKPEAIRTMVRQHIEKQKDYTFQLWALLMLELWHRKFIDGNGSI